MVRRVEPTNGTLDLLRKNYNFEADKDINKKFIDVAFCGVSGLLFGTVFGKLFFKNWRSFPLLFAGIFIG